MGAALAHTHTLEAPPPRGAHLSLVKPTVDRRALRVAGIISTWIDTCLSLDVRDARQLEKLYGWEPETSLGLGLRSVPGHTEGLVLLSELRQIVGDAEPLPPGFYTEPGALRFDCPRRFGLVVPVWRNWPAALMYYRHPGDTRPRWVSSADHPTGSAAVASVHCQTGPEGHAEVTRAFMLSHTLEAMAVSLAQGVSAVAHNGAAAAAVPAQLFEAFPKLRGVVVAMSDPPPRLERELSDAGLSVSFWKGGALI